MPPICLHLVIADEAAAQLSLPVLEANRSGYLMGATTPDIRLLSGVPREETHFFDLEAEHSGSSVGQLLRTHPDLARESGPSEGTRAFVAGYLSHLVTDEVWITEIYRPYFGRSSPLGSDPAANLLDRVLQFELDRRERLDRGKMAVLSRELETWQANVSLDFVETESLQQWREFVVRNTLREPSWESFRGFAERALLPRRGVGRERVRALLGSMPDLVARVLAHVPDRVIRAFRSSSLEGSVTVAREYLS